MISTSELARLSGASFRQVDSWKRNGVIEPHPRTSTGPGSYERWDEALVDVVRSLAAIQAGVNAGTGSGGLPRVILRRIVEHHDEGFLELVPGVVIAWPVAVKS